MSMSVLEFSGVTKRYGRVTALCDLSLKVEPGECLGLVGPNGAGKSTALKLWMGLVRPSCGRVVVMGKDPWRDPEARRHLGYLPERPSLYPEMRCRELIAYSARFYDLKFSKDEIEGRLARVGLRGVEDRRVRQLSKGMRQRLSLACALLHDPEVLLLDEPLSGLDPQGVREWRRLLLELKGHRTIVLSSHRLDVVEAICDRIAVLHRGRLLTLAHREALLGRGPLCARVELLNLGPELIEAVKELEGVSGVEQNGSGLLVQLRDRDAHAALARQIIEAGGKLMELKLERPSLDDLFTELTETEGGGGHGA